MSAPIESSTTSASASASAAGDEFEFAFTLDLMLDGFERLHAQGWSSAEN